MQQTNTVYWLSHGLVSRRLSPVAWHSREEYGHKRQSDVGKNQLVSRQNHAFISSKYSESKSYNIIMIYG